MKARPPCITEELDWHLRRLGLGAQLTWLWDKDGFANSRSAMFDTAKHVPDLPGLFCQDDYRQQNGWDADPRGTAEWIQWQVSAHWLSKWQELCPTDGELVSRIRDWIKDEFGSPVSVSDPAEAGLQGKLPMGHCRFLLLLLVPKIWDARTSPGTGLDPWSFDIWWHGMRWDVMTWENHIWWKCAASPESAAALHFAKAALWTVIDSKQLGNLDREGSRAVQTWADGAFMKKDSCWHCWLKHVETEWLNMIKLCCFMDFIWFNYDFMVASDAGWISACISNGFQGTVQHLETVDDNETSMWSENPVPSRLKSSPTSLIS